MARPQKSGLDYFPLDVDMDGDSAVCYVEAKHGHEGFYVFVKLLMRLYAQEGYYLPWSEREAYVFARRVSLDVDTVKAVVDDCIAEGLFDARVYDAFGVLTSKGIQSRYIIGTVRRSGVPMDARYLLAKDEAREARHISIVSVDANPAEVDSTGTETQESKGKETRVEESTKSIVDSAVAYLNEKTGKAYRSSTPATQRHISARIKEGFSLDDMRAVVDVKVAQWKGDPKMEGYLRPETLFGTKFESYLQERRQEVGNEHALGGFKHDAEELLGADA